MMKTNIKIPANSMKTRVLSMFLAFLIFALTFQQAFVGWDIGLRVRAEAGDGNIRATSTNKTSSMKSNIQTRANAAAGGTSPYTYSGEYTDKNNVTLFDYVSDYELIGTYNNCSQKEEGYVDAYNAFNNAISHSSNSITHQASDNMTIEFQAQYRRSNQRPTEVKVNYWDDNDHGSDFQTMTYFSQSRNNDGTYNYIYRYTVNKNDTVGNLTINSDTITHMQFKIDDQIINRSDDTTNCYSVGSNNGIGRKHVFINYCNSSDHPYDYFLGSSTGISDAIYNGNSTNYTNPLYFGCFWLNNYAGGYNNTKSPSYNHFFWQANIGLKSLTGIDDTNDKEKEGHFNQRGSASTQGLICSVLEGGARGNIKDTNGTTELPYFDKNSSLVSSGLMKYYDHDGTKGDIVFPFYEVTTTTGTSYTVKDQSNPSTTTTYSNLQIKNGDNLTGGSLASGEKARFYQFNSKDANLKFVIEDDDPSKNSGYFQESNNDIYRDNDVGTNRKNVGFFPFNSSDTANKGSTNTHNLGFGTKFEMDFQLEDDGCVSAVTVDQNGNVNDANSGTRIHSVFEFEGDDDLWVFIDGQLVLDMGGAHYKSHGIIDFASRTVTVDKAITLGADDGTSKDNLAATVRTPLDTGADCTRKSFTLSSSNSYDSNNKYTKRNHTMTIFYMERGMLDSNLLIRFNYAPTPNLSRMKIAEATRFDDVNPGLLSYTQKAAEDDIFQYTVKNNGTNSQDVKDNTAVYPKGVSSVRTNEGDSTITTQLQQGSNTAGSNSVNFEPHDTGSITNNDWASGGEQPVHDTSYLWVDKFAAQPKLTGKTNSNGQLYLMYGTDIAVYDSDDDKESSAEFEKQFSKDSRMRVIQGEKVYSPTRTANTLYNLFGGANNEVFQPSINNSRSVADYYTTTYKLVDRNFTEIPLTNYGLERNHDDYGTFTFSNATTTDQYQAVMLTEYFINTVNTGEISVTKEVTNEVSNEDVFEFTLSISDVFGVSGVLVGSNQYGSIDITGDATNSTGTGSATKLTSDGKFYIKGNGTVTISGIPVGTKYTITESTHTNYTSSTSPSSENQTIANGTLDTSGSSTVYVHSTKSYTITNTRRIGNLVLNKTLVNSTTPGSFNFAVTLNAPTGVSLSGITLDNVALSTQPTSGTSFTVTVPVTSGTTGQVTLGGIPYGTTYTVTETSGRPTGDGAGVTGEVTTPQTIDGVDDSVNIINTFPEVHEYPVTVTKTGNTGDNMSGAELELWYKETITPSTYSYNDPKPVPSQKMNGLTVTDTDKTVGVPCLAVTTEKTKKYTNSVAYTNPTVPNSDEKEWILPRNDSDYIYFRDFNTGTYTADKDAISFSSNSANNSAGKRSWVETTFAANGSGTHYQDQELGFANTNLWVAAQFTGSGKQMVQYAVWERFVDKFSFNNTLVDTVVWKIQPPDGYTQVRFLVYDGGNCIRTTEQFTYQLGRIYHKTNWGGSYSPAYGGSYYDVPVNKSDAPLWAPAENGTPDQRNTDMEQARKYEPTEQKVIFTCNSLEVWHNIHIEFFTYNESNSTYERVNGQPFPGYMMEPYAYAQSNYRLPGANDRQYLTYELTIPKGATHFRINNGVDNSTTKGSFDGDGSGGQSPYAFRTKITALKTTNGTKNFDNYYAFSSTVTNTVSSLNSGSPRDVPLVKATSGISALSGEDTAKTYSTVEVESDYDFIYFEWPSSWGSNPGKVYAYFYGGGNLREDNWQRACYSAWPGVAPVGTEYVSDSTNVYSTTYTYPTNSKYNGKTATSDVIPEATFTSGGKTIYRFRIPKGDRKNYSKVVFNNGLSIQSGGQETGVIEYKRGYIYNKHGNATKHYENSPTISYTASTVSGNIEYIFVQNGPGWSDLHVTFYDANGGQILQGGSGYLMEYAGDDYYKIPLPTDAKYVSVNNGMNGSLKSEKAEIIRLDTDGSPKSAAEATDRFVYNLTPDKKLTRAGITTSSSYTEDTNIYPQEEVNTDYAAVRQTGGTDDVLYIRDEYGWNAAIGAVSVKFYKADGTSAGNGVMMKTNPDSDSKVWYTKKIPTNAVSFVVGYYNGSSSISTPSYPIYPTTGDGNKTTSGNMFYKTASASTLEITHAKAASTPVNDETYDQRGDDLYLVKNDSGAMKVTFYGAGDVAIRSGITAKYINVDDNSDHWFKVSIPTGAKSFSIDSDSSTKYDIYELKAKYSPYQKDYTVGDMQYRVGNTTPLYPVFTEDGEYTAEIGGKEISSRSPAPQVEDSAVESYATANAYTLPTSSASSPADTPVLYETSVDDVKYKWTEGTTNPNYNYVRFVDKFSWDEAPGSGYPVRAYFFGSTSGATSSTLVVDYVSYELDSSNNKVYKFPIPEGNYAKVIFTNRINSSGEWNASQHQGKTNDITLVGNNTVGYGHGYLYKPNSTGDGVDVTILEPEPTYAKKLAFKNNVSWTAVYAVLSGGMNETDANGIPLTNTGSNNIWEVDLSNYNGVDYSDNTSVTFINRSGKQTALQTLSSDSKDWLFTPAIDNYIYLQDSTEYNVVNGNVNDVSADNTGGNNFNASGARDTNILGEAGYKWSVTGSTMTFRFRTQPNMNDRITIQLNLNSSNNYGQGKVYKVYKDGTEYKFHDIGSKGSGETNNFSGSWSTYNEPEYGIVTNSQQTTLTYTYQPEDRYGMISVDNSASTPVTLGTADVNDFIKIVSSSDLYIKFFSGLAGAGTELGTSSASPSKGLKIAYAAMVNTSNNTDYTSSAQPGAGTVENPYMVRIPKGAKSFTITNGDGTRSGTYDLSPSSITVNAEDGQLTSSGDQITLTDFYHAGSTFTVTNGSASDALNIALTDVRDGYTVARQTSMTDPLNPRTDADYIFFTDDSSNTFGGSGSTKTVYAYFYGDKDGEYTAWPGIKATTANTSVAETTYTDNAGRTVYMFRVPQTADGKYKYVIFNDGSTANSRKITQAVQYVKGSNYYLVPVADAVKPYGTTTSSTYAVTNENKATNASTVGYNTAGTNKYIYIINNGTKDLAGSTTTAAGTHTALDEMHVTFFDGNKAPIGDGAPGYKPDRVAENVYRIQAPADAKYFQINNGANKGTGDPSRIRQSEIKQLSPNGLYKFVDAAYLTSLGKDNTVAANYIEGNSVPASANDCWKPNYLLALTNPRVMEDGDPPVPETYDVHIATVVTKADGTVDYIKWVKNSPSNIDSNYIANTSGDIGSSGNHTPNVKVVKQGDYYWKEVVAPSGYQINPANIGFNVSDTTLVTTTVPDPPNPTGQLTLNKKLATVKSTANSGENQSFTFNVTLTAPVGTKWQSSPLTFQTKTGSNPAVTVTPTSDVYSDTNLTRTISISIPATGLTDYIIGNIPSGTYYSVTETSPTDYSDEPVTIYKDNDTTHNLDEISGNIPSEVSPATNDVSYAVTNKRKVGGLTLEKVADGEYVAANVNVPDTTTHEISYTEFTYTVTLTAPENVDFRDYIKWADFTNTITGLGATVTKINGTAVSGTPETDFNNAAPLRTIEFTVKVKANNGSKLVKNLPIGTKYTVTEVDPISPIDTSNWSKSGEVTDETEMDTDNLNPTVTITNTFGSCEIVLTKTAKEKVGTTDIGNVLAGAKFKLVDANDDSKVIKFSLTTKASDDVTGKQTNVYSANTSGTHNVTNTWLKTGEDGRLHIKGLSPGDYYLEEQEAPNGYSNLDSNRLDNGNAQPKRVYFSAGDNTKLKNITCSDEMAPAYIKLFEHINEYRPTEWGNPTFIFKIKQTGYYAWSTPANEGDTPEWQLTATNSGKEILVALTVNDNGTLDSKVLSNSVTGKTFTGWKVESTDENIAVDENTTVKEYQGMFDIDSQGRIRVEPGSYEITRMPVSRYEFVTSAKTAPYDNSGTAGDQTENLDSNSKPLEKVTISPLEAGKTVDVHYYDEVGYYDKFSQVDTNVNQFYQLNSTTKANKTIKGIRIADYYQVGTTTIGSTAADTVEVTDDTTNPATTTQTMTVPVGNLKIFKIMSDGSEVEMTSAEKAALTNFNITYTYDSNSGDKREFGGKAAEGADPAVPAQFSYSKTDKQITVTDTSDFENSVYTLNADYKGFKATFDIVFLRSST